MPVWFRSPVWPPRVRVGFRPLMRNLSVHQGYFLKLLLSTLSAHRAVLTFILVCRNVFLKLTGSFWWHMFVSLTNYSLHLSTTLWGWRLFIFPRLKIWDKWLIFTLFLNLGDRIAFHSPRPSLLMLIFASIFICFIGILWYKYCVCGAIRTPSVWRVRLGKYNAANLDNPGINFTFSFLSSFLYFSISFWLFPFFPFHLFSSFFHCNTFLYIMLCNNRAK